MNYQCLRYQELTVCTELFLHSSSVTPEDWQDFSHQNIEKAERERQSSVDLRSVVDGILQQTANDMRKQCSNVNVAFGKRISETKDTKSKLEDHLNKVRNLESNFSLVFSSSVPNYHLNKVQSTLAISTSVISNDWLSRSEILVPVLT